MAGIAKDGKTYASVNPDGYVAKTDIATAIDSTCTNEQVASAKAIYSKFRTLEIRDYFANFGDNSSLAKLGIGEPSTLTSLLDISKRLIANTRLTMQTNNADYQLLYDNGVTPVPKPGLLVITIQSLRALAIYTTDDGEVFESSTSNSYNTAWTDWERVCTTKVADVPFTELTSTNATKYEISSGGYYVTNGVCHVMMQVKCVANSKSSITINESLPKPITGPYLFTATAWRVDKTYIPILGSVNENILGVLGGEDGTPYDINFSYKVAES